MKKAIYLFTISLMIGIIFSCTKEEDDEAKPVTETKPIAKFSLSTNNAEAPIDVQFTNQSTAADSYLWKFGDGTISIESNPTHTYTYAGNFNVRLIATNASGVDSVTQSLIINFSNPNPAQNNQQISSQFTWGATTEDNSVYQIIDAGDGTMYYRGWNSTATSERVVGKLSTGGGEIWKKAIGYKVRGILRIPNTSGELQDALCAFGGYNSDADTLGISDEAKITLFNTSGTQLNELTITEPNFQVRLNHIAVTSASEQELSLIGVGGAYDASQTDYPYFVELTINSSGTITKGKSKIISQLPKKRIGRVVVSPDFQNSYVVFISNYTNNHKKSDNISVAKFNNSFVLQWNVDILNGDLKTFGSQLIYKNQKFYISGWTEDNKEPEPSDGGNWYSGLVACISPTGQLNWQKKISLSNKDDQTYDLIYHNNTLFAAGTHSGLNYSNANKNFQNGTIVKIDAFSGNTLGSYTFGDKLYYSSFNSLVLMNNNLVLAGFTKDFSGGNYRNWLVNVPVSNL